jgi:plastocyanin
MRRVMLVAAAVGAALIPLAGCGDDDDDGDAGGDTTTPATEAGATTTPATDAAAATTAPAGTGTAAGGTGGGAAGDATITLTEFAFPPETQLAAGGTLTVVNETAAAHTVTELENTFNEEVGAGETIEIQIDEPGSYEYVCNFHAQMTGVINVE